MVESFKPLEDSEEKNRKIKILDIEIKFPSSDKEGPEYAKRLEELIKDMDLPEDYLNIIKASLIIAKSRGTEENNKQTPWLRRSGRAAMTHFLESAVVALSSIPDFKKVNKDILVKIVSIALLHDVVEDSKGLYNFEKLKEDLIRLSEKSGPKLTDLINCVVEGVKRLTIEENDKNDVDLVLKMMGEIPVKNKTEFEIAKQNLDVLINEYMKKHNEYKKELKKALEEEWKFMQVVGKYFFNSGRWDINPLFLEIRGKMEELLNLLDYSVLDENDIVVILVRLSETITAIGPVDIKGFLKGEYGVIKYDFIKAIYLPVLLKVAEPLDKYLGAGTYRDFFEIFKKYLDFAERYRYDNAILIKHYHEYSRRLYEALKVNPLD